MTKFHFLQFQKWPKINFWTENKFNIAKNAISHKKFFLIYLISRPFYAKTFLIFWPAVNYSESQNSLGLQECSFVFWSQWSMKSNSKKVVYMAWLCIGLEPSSFGLIFISCWKGLKGWKMYTSGPQEINHLGHLC